LLLPIQRCYASVRLLFSPPRRAADAANMFAVVAERHVYGALLPRTPADACCGRYYVITVLPSRRTRRQRKQPRHAADMSRHDSPPEPHSAPPDA